MGEGWMGTGGKGVERVDMSAQEVNFFSDPQIG